MSVVDACVSRSAGIGVSQITTDPAPDEPAFVMERE